MGTDYKPPVTFGSWLSTVRQELGLTLQQISDKSGLPTGTISRIERERVRVTLINAFRLAECLDFYPRTLYRRLTLDPIRSDEENSEYARCNLKEYDSRYEKDSKAGMFDHATFYQEAHHNRAILEDESPDISGALTSHDTQRFLRLTTAAPEQAQTLLSKILNEIATVEEAIEVSYPFGKVDAIRLLEPLPFYTSYIPYPELTTHQLTSIYRENGSILDDDVAYFPIRALRELIRQVGDTPRSLQTSLVRLMSLSLEYTPLDTVLEVDTALKQNGLLLEQYWLAYQMRYQVSIEKSKNDRLRHDIKQEETVVMHRVRVFLTLYRWLFKKGLTDVSWIRSHLAL